jgi:hypothetical protein
MTKLCTLLCVFTLAVGMGILNCSTMDASRSHGQSGLNFEELPIEGEPATKSYGHLEGTHIREYRASDGKLLRVSREWFTSSTRADDVLADRLKGASEILDPPDNIEPGQTETDRSSYRAVATFNPTSGENKAVVFVVVKRAEGAGDRNWSMITSIEGPSLDHVYALEEVVYSEDY